MKFVVLPLLNIEKVLIYKECFDIRLQSTATGLVINKEINEVRDVIKCGRL